MVNKWLNHKFLRGQLMVKLPHYRSGQALRASGGWGSQNFKTLGTWRWKGSQPYALTIFTPRKYSWVLIFVKGRVGPRNLVQPEGLGQWKITVTPLRIDPASFWLVAQFLNQLHPIPFRIQKVFFFSVTQYDIVVFTIKRYRSIYCAWCPCATVTWWSTLLKTQRNLLCIKNQSVPLCKHFPPRL